MKRLLEVMYLLLAAFVVVTLCESVPQSTKNTTCQTPTCYDIAEQLEQDMNTTIDPCEDFYGHVCGKWMAKHEGNEKMARKFQDPGEVINRRFQEILESEYNSKYPPVLQDALTYYSQCTAIHSMNKTQLIMDFVKSKKLTQFGGWPIITENWNESSFNLEKVLIHLHQDFWINAIFGTDARFADETGKPGDLQLEIENPLESLGRMAKTKEPEGLLLKSKQVKKLVIGPVKEMAENFLVTDGALNGTNQMSEDLAEMKTFVLELGEIGANCDLDLSESYTLSELNSSSKNMNWLNYYKSVFGHEAVNETSRVYTNSSAVKRVNELLERTSKRTVANYVIWKFLEAYMLRATDCVSGTKDAFKHGLGALYVKRYLDNHMFSEIKEFMNEVRGLFDKLLDQATWMDDITRERAKKKLAMIKTNVGYPEIYRDEQKLKDFYRTLNITQGNDLKTYLANVDATFKFEASSHKESRVKRNIDNLYKDGAVVTNAYYSPVDNSIAVLAGILIEPFYHPHRPLAMNFGAIGYIVGHEFTHGFDNEGRNYDEIGRKENWWTNHSAEQYQKRYECYLDHYALLVENSTNATEYSKYTAAENIADGGGLHEAYEALKSVMKKREAASQRLPGIMNVYTPEQLFFVSFAHSFCAYIPPNRKRIWMYSDPHSMDNDRVVGNIANSRGFAEAFNCSTGSRMNPPRKCSLFE